MNIHLDNKKLAAEAERAQFLKDEAEYDAIETATDIAEGTR
jgi:hypothetical protein